MRKIILPSLLILVALLTFTCGQPQVLQKGTVIIYYAKYKYGKIESHDFVNFTVVSLNKHIVIKVSSNAEWMKWLTGTYKVNRNGIVVEGKYEGTAFILWINSKEKYLNTLGYRYICSGEEILESEHVLVYLRENSMLTYRMKDFILYSAVIPFEGKNVSNYHIILALYAIEQPAISLNDAVLKAVSILEEYSFPLALLIAVVSLLLKKILVKKPVDTTEH